jgi:hypothetical protein
MTNELCNFLTQPQVEDQYDAGYEQWLTEVSADLDLFERDMTADDAPGMLESFPHLWFSPVQLVGCAAEEETLA